MDLKEFAMSDENERSDTCEMKETDARGRTNLCCCYTMDEEDNYEDPCYTPAEDCCCC